MLHQLQPYAGDVVEYLGSRRRHSPFRHVKVFLTTVRITPLEIGAGATLRAAELIGAGPALSAALRPM